MRKYSASFYLMYLQQTFSRFFSGLAQYRLNHRLTTAKFGIKTILPVPNSYQRTTPRLQPYPQPFVWLPEGSANRQMSLPGYLTYLNHARFCEMFHVKHRAAGDLNSRFFPAGSSSFPCASTKTQVADIWVGEKTSARATVVSLPVPTGILSNCGFVASA